MNKRVKIWSACALALAVIVSGLTIPGAYAADAVDTGRTCSIEFDLACNVDQGTKVGDEPTYIEELTAAEETIKLYKVADIAATGKYTAVAGFESLGLESINSDTSATEWANKAEAAKTIVEDSNLSAIQTATIGAGQTKATVGGLATGMYLIVPEDVESDYFKYSFNANLISLPNNYYDPDQIGSSDAWVYDLIDDGTVNHAVGLKPGREELKGSLEINKDLDVFNATYDSATFIFNVHVKKLDGTETNNVYKMEFTGAGGNSLEIDNLPAGATVTVTEVYSGASYSLTSANDQQVIIIADDSVSVSFTNTHNGGQNGGSGVVNRYYNKEGAIDVEAEGSDAR